jgi:hypothetical protein
MLCIACKNDTTENFIRFTPAINVVGYTPEPINEETTERFPDLV